MGLEHRDFHTLDLHSVLEATRKVRYRSRRCVEAFLERCQEETFRNPHRAVPLLLEGPEYVQRCRRALGRGYPDFLVRVYGSLGSALTISHSLTMASQFFEQGRLVENVSAYELAALNCRISSLEICCENWRRALELTNDAVLTFESDDGRSRDDRSLATALVYRAIARVSAYRLGEEIDLDDVIRDHLRALENSPRWFKKTRLAALSGIGAAAACIWFSGQTTRYANPMTIVEMMERFRATLRREDIPFKSLVDARARWILGLGVFKLMGGLSDFAEKHFLDARAVLMEIGPPQYAVELTLDYHWCLLHDERLSRALADWSDVEPLMDVLPEKWQVVLGMWGDALRRREIEGEVVRKVFSELRGIRDVQVPRAAATPADDAYDTLGW